MTPRPLAPSVFLALLAGGRGTRFWPLSRQSLPKQFLPLGGEKTLLQQTRERFAPLVAAERTFVIARAEYEGLIRSQLPELPPGNILAEPSPRDTAPAIGLAALEARRRAPDALLIVSPSDHRVSDPEAFRAAVTAAVLRAGEGGLGTLGVEPDRAATSFGYLRTGPAASDGARPVERFVEKPDQETARRFLDEGNYLWNAGLFVFRVAEFFQALAKADPGFAAGLEALESARESGRENEAEAAWARLPATSLDYALMERASGVWTIPLKAGWDDVGTWAAAEKPLSRDEEGNASAPDEEGGAVFTNSSNSSVFLGGGRERGPLPVLVGVEDLIVVSTRDVVLVCRRDRVEEVRRAVEELRRRGRDELL